VRPRDLLGWPFNRSAEPGSLLFSRRIDNADARIQKDALRQTEKASSSSSSSSSLSSSSELSGASLPAEESSPLEAQSGGEAKATGLWQRFDGASPGRIEV